MYIYIYLYIFLIQNTAILLFFLFYLFLLFLEFILCSCIHWTIFLILFSIEVFLSFYLLSGEISSFLFQAFIRFLIFFVILLLISKCFFQISGACLYSTPFLFHGFNIFSYFSEDINENFRMFYPPYINNIFLKLFLTFYVSVFFSCWSLCSNI